MRFQYSLRTLLLAMLIAGAACAAFTTRLKAIRTEQKAKDMIERIGGSVRYAYPSSSGKWMWLRSVLGPEWPPHHTFVDLMGCRVTGETLACLGDFDRITILNLADAPVDDNDLRYISGLRDLGYLSVAGTAVSNAGLPHLQVLFHLEVLSLQDTQVTDEGCAAISTMSSLKQVTLGGRVTDDGRATLRRLRPDIEILD